MSQSGGAVDASATTPVMTKRQIRLVIYGLMAGMFLSSLDQTIVGTSIRTIGDDLHGLDQQAWVTTAYLICATVILLAAYFLVPEMLDFDPHTVPAWAVPATPPTP